MNVSLVNNIPFSDPNELFSLHSDSEDTPGSINGKRARAESPDFRAGIVDTRKGRAGNGMKYSRLAASEDGDSILAKSKDALDIAATPFRRTPSVIRPIPTTPIGGAGLSLPLLKTEPAIAAPAAPIAASGSSILAQLSQLYKDDDNSKDDTATPVVAPVVHFHPIASPTMVPTRVAHDHTPKHFSSLHSEERSHSVSPSLSLDRFSLNSPAPSDNQFRSRGFRLSNLAARTTAQPSPPARSKSFTFQLKETSLPGFLYEDSPHAPSPTRVSRWDKDDDTPALTPVICPSRPRKSAATVTAAAPRPFFLAAATDLDTGSIFNHPSPKSPTSPNVAPAGETAFTIMVHIPIVTKSEKIFKPLNIKIKFIAEGSFHSIFAIEGQPNRLLRVVNNKGHSDLGILEPRKYILKTGYESYKKLQEARITVPEIYNDPFKDGYYVIENIPDNPKIDAWASPATTLDKLDRLAMRQLQQVKEYFDQMNRQVRANPELTAGELVIPDFQPHNVKVNRRNELVIIDFCEATDRIASFTRPAITALKDYMNSWANGNPNIHDYLKAHTSF